MMTYRGHGVLHTLIRCRFSPTHSTGQQFIYSGCSTGKVVVYDLLSGHIVKKLTTHKACVRDVSWHPFEEKIVSSSWDGICVCGSTARLSTSRMTCQSRRSTPAPLPQCPTPLQPFPRPSRSDLQAQSWVSLFTSSPPSPPFLPMGNLWGLTGTGWGETEAQALGSLADPWEILPLG